MRFEISYRGQQAGWVIAQPDAHGILFRAESRVHTMAVLRLYGIAAGQPLLIGVLEPENGRLSLARRITPDVLRRAGVQQPPEVYYLEDGQRLLRSRQNQTFPRKPTRKQGLLRSRQNQTFSRKPTRKQKLLRSPQRQTLPRKPIYRHSACKPAMRCWMR